MAAQDKYVRMWDLLLNHPPSPLTELRHPAWQATGVQLFVKRDDLLAPAPGDPFCGNKWRKLKYNLLQYREKGYEQLLSFGGAYSNHLAALASAGQWLGISTIGVVRGDEPMDSPTLRRAEAAGMRLIFIARSAYRRLSQDAAYWQALYPNAYILPEGGSNEAALRGCAELAQEIRDQLGAWPEVIATACGTGGTLAGLILGVEGEEKNQPLPHLLGVPVLKGGFMAAAVEAFLQAGGRVPPARAGWDIADGFHHGGYAKKSADLMHFIENMHDLGLPLEPVYTAKLFYALFSLQAGGRFAPGSRLVAIHTGGLQGIQP